jgi:hypothetical protein
MTSIRRYLRGLREAQERIIVARNAAVPTVTAPPSLEERLAGAEAMLDAHHAHLMSLEARATPLPPNTLRHIYASELPCTCPVGWGHVRDVNCPRHRGAAHTVSGACQ